MKFMFGLLSVSMTTLLLIVLNSQMLQGIVCYSDTVCPTILAEQSRCQKGLMIYYTCNAMRKLHWD